MPSEIKSRFRNRTLRFIISYGIAAGCLYWVFHGLDLRSFLHSFTTVNWLLLLPSIVADLVVYVIAGWEWQILLRPATRISIVKTTQAVFAGRFANDVLPVHVGYVVRTYLVSRWTDTRITAVAPSLLVERLFDTFWLALGMGLTAAFFPLPEAVKRTADIWVGIVVFGLIAGAVIMLQKPKRPTGGSGKVWRWPWLRNLIQAGAEALEQVRSIGRSPTVLAAFAVSLLKLAVQALAFVFILWACGFQFPFWIQLAVFFVAYVGISLPSTPASIGVFQLFCVAGLKMVHVPKPAATGFATLAFLVLTLPLSAAGFFALAQSGLTLREVRGEVGKFNLPAEAKRSSLSPRENAKRP